jgi:hypothetical protein
LRRKKVKAAFDRGRLSSDSGVMLLSMAERRRALAKTLAALIDDPRDPAHVTHTTEDVLRARMFAIACGYPDGNDFNRLRFDPAFKLACGRLPETGTDLCSQSTVSRAENAPTLKEIIRLSRNSLRRTIPIAAHNNPADKGRFIRPGARSEWKLTYVFVDVWCRSYAKPPAAVVLDIVNAGQKTYVNAGMHPAAAKKRIAS